MSELSSLVGQLADRIQETLLKRGRRPRATYRLQFHRDSITFSEAAALVPYLAALGISHIYASPYRRARAGSPHGYALVDYAVLNPELGGFEDYQAMVAALGEHGMGHLPDIVPNHMCISSDENFRWNDVLENGPSSPFAAYFDIDWHPVKEELENRILLPVLGDQYGTVLESGQLRVTYGQGAFRLHFYDRRLPLDPKTYGVLLGHRLDELKPSMPADSEALRELESILTALGHLPDRTDTAAERVAERQREKEVIKGRLDKLVEGSPEIAAFIQRNVAEINGQPGDPRSFDALDKLLDAQGYRLAHWKTAGDEINYRRFFDINDLAAVCMENRQVFEDFHELLFDLLVRGDIAGLRVDHVDGLYDPTEYLGRLQWGYLRSLGRCFFESTLAGAGSGDAPPAVEDASGPCWQQVEPLLMNELWRRLAGMEPSRVFADLAVASADDVPSAVPSPASEKVTGAFCLQGPEGASHKRCLSPFPTPWPPLYVLVEKILGPEEPLPHEWPAAGTTGYDFLNHVASFLVDPAGLKELARIYARFVGRSQAFAEVAHDAKMAILRVAMASDVQMLALRLNRLSERHRRTRDFTLNSLRGALREIMACFPVYRTYIHKGVITDRDRRIIQRAAARAKRRNAAYSSAVFDFVRDVLLLEQPPELDEAGQRAREVFVGRFQQVTSPVMAKGIEDTAFYRHFPLASLNEVGGNPEANPMSPERFHQENLARRTQYPHALIATTTHDTKRSEDARARIGVLSEVPQLWRKALSRWARLNRHHRREVDGLPAPSRNDEYLFYQSLVGVWPLAPPGREELRQLVERLQAYMEKASREAKLHTSWISPEPQYDAALREFVAAVLDDRPKNRFLADFRAFHERIVDWGLYTALTQVALKLMSPGVPDIYQGQELWDFSLVDPDNRRPVDFACRREMLGQLQAAVAGSAAARSLSQNYPGQAQTSEVLETSEVSGKGSKFELARTLARHPRDPRLKLYVTWQLLEFRRQNEDLFAGGEYVPLEAAGACAAHVCAFAWRTAPEAPSTDADSGTSIGERPRMAVLVVPRLIARLVQSIEPAETPPAPLGPEVWKDTTVTVPGQDGMTWENHLTGQPWTAPSAAWPLSALLEDFPVALLLERSDFRP